MLGKTGMDKFLETKEARGDVGKSHTAQTVLSAVFAAGTVFDALTRDPNHGTMMNGKFAALLSASMCVFLVYRLAVPVAVDAAEEEKIQ